jgi:hypothetical protein
MVSLPHRSSNQHAAPVRQVVIFRDLYLGLAQVPDKNEAGNEAEQFIERAWLTEAKKTKLSNLLKTKDHVSVGFFVENEPEHSIENKQH